MSEESKEFLVDKDYMWKDDELTACDLDDYIDIPSLLDEYFAFRLGKMIFDGEIKRCDDAGDTVR